MRISDWSSDVCSSDLADADRGTVLQVDDRARRQQVLRRQVGPGDGEVLALLVDDAQDRAQLIALRTATPGIRDLALGQAGQVAGLLDPGLTVANIDQRSETAAFHTLREVHRNPMPAPPPCLPASFHLCASEYT